MSNKSIVFTFFIILITTVFIQNTDEVIFKFLWTSFYIPKLMVMIFVIFLGVILGIIIGAQKSKHNLEK